MQRKSSAVLACAFAICGTTLTTTAPASAAGTCDGRVAVAKQLQFDAFAGHSIIANNTFCFAQADGTYGPYFGIAGTTDPVVTFPSRLPAGGGESVELVQAPYVLAADATSHVYRFSVRQGPAFSPVKQTFNFNIYFDAYGKGKICFDGAACGPVS